MARSRSFPGQGYGGLRWDGTLEGSRLSIRQATLDYFKIDRKV